ncbi:MAG: hypothetical protein ABI475_02115 [Methylophilaceae bacterium]
MDISYSHRLNLLYGLCLVEAGSDASTLDIEGQDALESATYLACYITFQAIRYAERSPTAERMEDFDMLSVYQTYAMLVYVYLTLPLGIPAKYPAHSDNLGATGVMPDLVKASVTIAKSLFAELSNEEWVEIIDAGNSKFQLIGDAAQEHWMNYRQDLDKAVITFVIAGTDDNTEFEKEEIIPLFGALLSMLCEAFLSS